MLETVGLAGLGRRYPHQLSGGQQQRVALARALAIEPAVVLLDEPFASLDAHLRASVRADVQDIFRRAGTTAVLVTHDQDEALSMADRVAVLRDGRSRSTPPPRTSTAARSTPDLASFVGEANLLEGVLNGAVVKTLLGNLPAGPRRPRARHRRPGHRPDPPRADRTRPRRPPPRPQRPPARPRRPSAADGLPGRVTSYGYHGHDAVLHVQPDRAPDDRTLVVRIIGGPHLPVGSPVTLRARGPVFAWPRSS